MIPFYIYFIAVPWINKFWIPLLPKWLTGYEPPLPVFGPELEYESPLIGWGWSLAKWVCWGFVILIVVMLLIWRKQEAILYVPTAPL